MIDGAAVISVGNLAMGGRGKTPLVQHLARLCLDAGERPAILSRGYGRRLVTDGVTIVSDGARVVGTLDDSGDEPLMLARTLPGVTVLVCDERRIAAALATHTLGATLLLLDDGFQHRVMPRDVDLVLVAPEDLEGRRLPFGRLRESPSALSRADAVIVDALDPVPAVPGAATQYRLERHLGPPLSLDPSRPFLTEMRRVVAVAGIASPERFTSSLRGTEWDVVETLGFSDHHRYDFDDLARITRAVARHGAEGVLTTEKDAVRLEAAGGLPLPVGVVPLWVSVEPADDFRQWLLARVAQARWTPVVR